jgi:peptide chain release factor 1
MWRRCGALFIPGRSRFPWLDSNGYQAFASSPEFRERATGGRIVESILSDISETEKQIGQLQIELKDNSLADLRELVLGEIEAEKDSLGSSSNKLRDLVLIQMEKEGLFDMEKLNARIEVKAGVGGDEALKWADEIFEMYRQVSARLGWKFDVEDSGKAVVSSHDGTGVYGWLRFESGVHRVQRVPFNSDRMQTSAAAVYVVPKIEIPTVQIRDSDLKIHISKKSSGAGGQSVNAAYQQVRMTHVPTGFTVVCNESHAQQENKEMALERIKLKVQQMEEEKALAAMANARKGQVRTADRSEKVRSYNFQRSEVNDHRLSGGVVKESCEEFMSDCGSLVSLWEKLKETKDNEMINEFLVSMQKKK